MTHIVTRAGVAVGNVAHKTATICRTEYESHCEVAFTLLAHVVRAHRAAPNVAQVAFFSGIRHGGSGLAGETALIDDIAQLTVFYLVVRAIVQLASEISEHE